MDFVIFLLTWFAAPCPVDAIISSDYGFRTHPITNRRKFHTGVDLAAPEGRTVIAPYRGVVERVGKMGPYGLTVVIRTGRLRWHFSHLSATSVRPSQIVYAGTEIGKVGQTGRATGPHLHLELRVGRKRTTDPTRILWRCRDTIPI